MASHTGGRVLSHQLSNGLYVSGAPDQYKDRQPSMTSTAMPYTGGDIKRSGELGKMFDIPVEAPKMKKSGPITGGALRGSFSRTTTSNSGPLAGNNPSRPGLTTSGSQGSVSGPLTGAGGVGNRQGSNSGPLTRNSDANVGLKSSASISSTVAPGMARQNSGPLAPNLPATGLITSGPVSSGPLSSSGAPKKHSGPIESGASAKLVSGYAANNQAVNNLSHYQQNSFTRNIPKPILYTVIPLFAIGFVAGAFILGAVKNAILLIVVAFLFGAVSLLLLWNACLAKTVVTGFVASYSSAGLGNANDGQIVKVTGVVTCGSVPLESSYHRVNRCVYTSTGLYEYRGFKAKPARPKHRTFTWGLRYLERHVTDFYISDFQSGLRALVKSGYAAAVTPFVEESTIVDITNKNRELPSSFLTWLAERNLSSDDRVMRLKEGYIKEGSTITIMGVVQRNDNVLMIVPPSEPISTGCQWSKFFLPANLEGIILRHEDTSKADVIPV